MSEGEMNLGRGHGYHEGTGTLEGTQILGGLGRHGPGKGHGPQRRALISRRDMGLGRVQNLDHMKAISPPLPWRG